MSELRVHLISRHLILVLLHQLELVDLFQVVLRHILTILPYLNGRDLQISFRGISRSAVSEYLKQVERANSSNNSFVVDDYRVESIENILRKECGWVFKCLTVPERVLLTFFVPAKFPSLIFVGVSDVGYVVTCRIYEIVLLIV